MADKKYGRNKKWCEHYKSIGQRERNKALKQERAKKREARFAKRREEGKTYQYKVNPFDENSPSFEERRKFAEEQRARAAKNVDRRDSVSQMKSLLRKVQNELDKEAAELKKRFDGKKRKEALDG